MPQFNVGDRVRRISDTSWVYIQGEIYTVGRLARDGQNVHDGFYTIEYPNVWGWETKFELVEAAPPVDQERQSVVLWTVVFREVDNGEIRSSGLNTKEAAEHKKATLERFPRYCTVLALKKITVRI